MSRSSSLLLLLSSICVSVWTHLSLVTYATDDAYIHFRIVSNFLEHGEPYFNLHSPVMTSSSALWTLFISAVFFLFGQELALIAACNAVFTTLAAFALLRVYRHARGPAVLSVGEELSVYMVSFFGLLPAGVQLMETPLALWLLAEAILAYQREKLRTGALFMLAIFVRLELILFAGCFFAHSLYGNRGFALKAGCIALIAALPFVIFDLYYFGTLIPQTVYAKSQIYSLSVLQVVSLILFEYYGDYISREAPVLLLSHIVVCLGLAITSFNSLQFPSHAKIFLLMLISAVCLAVAYVFAGVFVFPWYHPLYMVPLLVSFVYLSHTIERRSPLLFSYLILLPVFFVGTRNVYAAVTESPEYFEEFEGGAKARKYLQVGKALDQFSSEVSLMAAEIGALGFHFPGKVYDAAGLASPEALEHWESGSGMIGDIPPSYVHEKLPDLIIGLDLHVKRIEETSLLQDYDLILQDVYLREDAKRNSRNTVLRSKHLKLFVRKDSNLDRHALEETLP